jgi:pimeloyl-ACP methyl ester carboxylesterase
VLAREDREPSALGLGATAGLLIGTVGFAAEYGWSQFAMPLPWTSDLLPEGLVMAAAVAIAGGLVGGLFGAALRGELGGDQAERSTYMDFFRMEGTAEDAMHPTLRDMYVASGLGEEAADEYLRVLGDRAALTGGLNYYRANRFEDGLSVPEVTVPTLMIWSTADPFLGREGAEATASHVTGPYRFEVLEGASHWVPEQAADELNRMLLEHLAAQGRS